MKLQLLDKNRLLPNILNWINPFSRRTLKVWGANVASLKSKGEDLKTLLDSEEPDVVLLNETWLTSETTFDHPKYLQIATDFYQKFQGTAILLRNDSNGYYSCHQVKHKNKNLTEIVLKIDPENKIHFISIYAPPQGNDDRDQQRLEALDDFYSTVKPYAKNSSYKCIGYSDFNARLRRLVDTQDLDAKNLLKSLKQNKLKLIFDLKPSSYTRSGINFKNEVSQSYIDYFFYRNLNYKRFTIKDSIGKSDHNLLEVYVKKQITVKLWIYFILLLIIPLAFYYRKEISIDKIIKYSIDILDKFFSDDGSGGSTLSNIKQTIQSVVPTVIPKTTPHYYTFTAVILLAFSFLLYICFKYNILFF